MKIYTTNSLMIRYNEFFEHVTTSDGKLSSNAMRLGYFERRGLSDLWNEFLSATSLYEDLTIPQRVHVLRIKKHVHRPLCETCGLHPVVFMNSTLSKFCSKPCARKSPINKGNWKDPELAKKRRIETNMKRYGVEQYSQTEMWKSTAPSKMSEVQVEEESRLLLLNKGWMYTEYVVNQRSVANIAEELGVYSGTVLNRIDEHGIPRQTHLYSAGQKEIFDFISTELHKDCSMDVSGEIFGKNHIDIYVPEFKFGIEYNGLYHHSIKNIKDINRSKDKHYKKTISSWNNGIDLIHITDKEWEHKKEIVKSIIRSKTGCCERVYARNCELVTISKAETNSFLLDNHLNGVGSGTIRFGLIHSGTLVFVMTFDKLKRDKLHDYEITRFCSKLNTTVVGGLSKVVKFFVNTVGSTKLKVCVDRMKSRGSALELNGFRLINSSSPEFGYTNGRYLIDPSKCNLRTYKAVVENYDGSISDEENMYNAKFRKYFNCGTLTFSYDGLKITDRII